MGTADIKKEIAGRIESRHWQYKRLCSLVVPGYVRDVPVTPFFSLSILRKVRGAYAVSGFIGVVHREFERAWLSQHPLSKDTDVFNRFCLALHIANVPNLSHVVWIHEDAEPHDIGAFCEVLLPLLEQMPHSELELAKAFERDELIGIPLAKFIAYGQDAKFESLISFITDRNRSAESPPSP